MVIGSNAVVKRVPVRQNTCLCHCIHIGCTCQITFWSSAKIWFLLFGKAWQLSLALCKHMANVGHTYLLVHQSQRYVAPMLTDFVGPTLIELTWEIIQTCRAQNCKKKHDHRCSKIWCFTLELNWHDQHSKSSTADDTHCQNNLIRTLGDIWPKPKPAQSNPLKNKQTFHRQKLMNQWYSLRPRKFTNLHCVRAGGGGGVCTLMYYSVMYQ